MRSVAIVGQFASGKTTLADHLVNRYAYTRVSFAKRLKEIAAAVYNLGVPIEKNGTYGVVREGGGVELSGRAILQELGQSVKSLDEHFWIRWLLNDIDNFECGLPPYVSDDTRFPYEAAALRERGFAIVRVRTPLSVRMQRYEALYGRRPTPAEMEHPSEVESEKIEADITLDGTQPVERLAEAIISTGAILAAV